MIAHLMAKSLSPKLSLRAIDIFLTAVEQQSVSKAGKRLGISPSTVSLQLSNLEEALGVRLIERSARHFQLTDAGRLFRQRAHRITDEIGAAKAELSTDRQSSHTILRMAMIEDFDLNVLPLWVSKLEARYNKLQLILTSGPSHESYSSLANRAVDMIVATNTMDSVDWIEEFPLLVDPFIAVACAKDAQIHTAETLLTLPFVRYSREQQMGRQIEAQLRRSRYVPPKRFEVTSNQAALSLVRETGGWMITTAMALQGVEFSKNSQPSDLHVIPMPVAEFSRTISLYARRNPLSTWSEENASLLRSALKDVLRQQSSFGDLATVVE